MVEAFLDELAEAGHARAATGEGLERPARDAAAHVRTLLERPASPAPNADANADAEVRA